MDISSLKFDKNGLIPAITTDCETGEVLMQAYMNTQSLLLSLETGFVHYFSRSRNEIWKKGATSGNLQKIVSIYADCDFDSLLLKVRQTGVACHTGEYSCFFNEIKTFETIPTAKVLYDDVKTISHRATNKQSGSYVNYLLEKGTDKICKKIGEEASEVIIAAKNSDNNELKCELADLYFHTLVLMQNRGLSLNEVFGVLEERKKSQRKKDY